MKSLRRTLSVPALAIALMLGTVGAARAGACYASGQGLPVQVVSQFMNDPGQLLRQSPGGGSQMISLIRDLVASDPHALPVIIKLDAKANAEQIEAIGIGLGQAALVCGRTEQSFAGEILLMTVTANNQPLSHAFSAVMGDLSYATTGPIGASGGGAPTATGGPIGRVDSGGATLNLTTSGPTGFRSPSWSGAFTSAPSGSTTSGSPRSLFTLGTPPGNPNVNKTSNTHYGSVSPSRP